MSKTLARKAIHQTLGELYILPQQKDLVMDVATNKVVQSWTTVTAGGRTAYDCLLPDNSIKSFLSNFITLNGDDYKDERYEEGMAFDEMLDHL